MHRSFLVKQNPEVQQTFVANLLACCVQITLSLVHVPADTPLYSHVSHVRAGYIATRKNDAGRLYDLIPHKRNPTVSHLCMPEKRPRIV